MEVCYHIAIPICTHPIFVLLFKLGIKTLGGHANATCAHVSTPSVQIAQSTLFAQCSLFVYNSVSHYMCLLNWRHAFSSHCMRASLPT